MTISARELEDILKIFETSDFDELLLEIDGVRVEARRNGRRAADVPVPGPTPAAAAPVPDGSGTVEPAVTH